MNDQTGQFRPLCSPGFICLVLALATLAVYFPVHNYGFVGYDDGDYFFANSRVLTGLTWSNVQWAFTTDAAANWHPLTWLSLMLDVTLFGSGAAGPHVTNVLLHTANSILLFLFFLRTTRAIWRSSAVAMLFAIHPLHVESVAWIAERKDVLSAFFGLLSLLCYVRYVESAGNREDVHPQSAVCKPRLFYGLSLFFFACGLMSKPMLVTLPCVMLLLDFWPLNRFPSSRSGDGVSPPRAEGQGRRVLQSILVEKIPFVLLTAAASVLTCFAQRGGNAIVPLSVIPFDARIGNAFVSYARYLGKIFCPTRLAVLYPFTGYWPRSVVFLSIVLFVGICTAAIAKRKKFPWLLTGWFWFAGMLVPVLGLVQVGAQNMADRYAYLPMVGVLLIVVWGVGEICLVCRPPRLAILALSALLFAAYAWRARDQVRYWKNDGSLFGRALAVTTDNYIAELDMGFWYSETGNLRQALEYYNGASKMAPHDPTALYNIGNAYARLGDWSEAIRNYERALQILPNQPDVMNNLGLALAQTRQIPEAVSNFTAAIQHRPDFADAHNNLGSLLYIQGHYVEAAREFYAAVQESPYIAKFVVNLGDTLVHLGKKSAAAECYQQALQLEPDNKAVQKKLQALGPLPAE